MKPQEVKIRITRIKKQMIIEKILIKTHERYREKKNYNERITKQKKIITEAEKAIFTIRHERKDSPKQIAKIKQNMRYEKRQLAILKNWEKIEQLEKTVNELKKIRKEITDGKECNDSKI